MINNDRVSGLGRTSHKLPKIYCQNYQWSNFICLYIEYLHNYTQCLWSFTLPIWTTPTL